MLYMSIADQEMAHSTWKHSRSNKELIFISIRQSSVKE